MVNGKENSGEMKAKVGGNTRWTMTSFAGETLQRKWIERTALPTNKIAHSTTSDELTRGVSKFYLGGDSTDSSVYVVMVGLREGTTLAQDTGVLLRGDELSLSWYGLNAIRDRPSTTDFDVSSQALEHLRFYFSMDKDENIWDLSWPNEVVRSCHYSEEKRCGHALDVPKCPYGSRRQAPRQQVTMLEARQAGDEQRDNEQRSLVTASPILEARLKMQKRKITDEAATTRVEGLKALEVFPKSTTSMERRSKRKADKDFNGTRRPETVVANESVEVGVKEITWAEGTPDDGRWLPLVPLNNEVYGDRANGSRLNGAMDRKEFFVETTSVSIPVGDITSVESLALVSAIFLDDEVIEALRPHADIDFSVEMVEEYMHDQLLLPELGSSNTKEVEETSELCILGMQTLQKAMENFAKLTAVLEKEKHAMPGPLTADLVQKEQEEAKAKSARAQMETMLCERRWQPCHVKRRRWCRR
ncbi:hypothetical protein IFM89_034958 [Coptis chinensis]|uniref:Uncharacterized protein n=1 Tax=Coptis chinensis TaxID=261450 RepID=A0A835MBJ4_9MAGN|nr:hypothetical protein IFM89_034958 [Coptis chinensis]